MGATVMQVLNSTVQSYPNKTAIKYKQDGQWKGKTWSHYQEEIILFGKGLIKLGLQAKEFITILSQNCKEWVIGNLSAIACGAVPAGIYPTCSADQCSYIINHCKASVILLENKKQLEKIKTILADSPSLKFIVLFNGDSQEEKIYSWNNIIEIGKKAEDTEINNRIKNQKPSDLATLVYTSGTTSNPKAVMLSHENLNWTAKTVCDYHIQMTQTDCMISYLPLSHIAEQMTTIHGPLYSGATVWFSEGIERLAENLKEVRPTIFLGVPRVWEKIQAAMINRARDNNFVQKKIVQWAKNVGQDHYRRLEEGMAPSIWFNLADKFVFRKIKRALGLDRCRLQVTAAAPISKATLEYFISLNIPLYEIFGMSECSGPTTISLPKEFKIGATGKPIFGSQIKISEDNEILIKGPHVFKGYLHNKTETKNVIDEDSWLHSGDIGYIDSENYLKITGRKKNIIITAGGENIAPEMIENKLTTITGLEHAVVIGDQKKYLSALLTLSSDALVISKNLGSEASNLVDLCRCNKFEKYLEKQIGSINTQMARVQTIKRFSVLKTSFTEEAGELTPTLKTKRSVIIEKFAEEISKLY